MFLVPVRCEIEEEFTRVFREEAFTAGVGGVDDVVGGSVQGHLHGHHRPSLFYSKEEDGPYCHMHRESMRIDTGIYLFDLCGDDEPWIILPGYPIFTPHPPQVLQGHNIVE